MGDANLGFYVFQKSEEQTARESGTILCVLIGISFVVYVVTGFVPPRREKRTTGQLRLSLRLGLAAAGALALVTAMAKTDIPKMQAAIVDFRLKSFIDTVQASTLSDERLRSHLKTVESVVGASSTNRIPVDPNVLDQAQIAIANSLRNRPLSEQTKQLGWATAIDLKSFAYARKVQTGEIQPRQINKTGYAINSLLTLDHKNVFVQGEHSLLSLGDSINIEHSEVVFDKIDFLGLNSGASIWLDDRSNLLIRDSILKDMTQQIDRITWVDVRFEDSQILYRGGAIRFRGVTFKDCDLSRLWGSGLDDRIKEAQGQPITFVFEPKSK